MKLLVIGAQGQVGSELCLQNSSEFKIVGMGRNELDVTDKKQVNGAIEKQKPDFVINASAYTAVDKAEEEADLAYAVNSEGPKNLARSCVDKNIPLIHISTDYVFDGNATTPYKEEDTTKPANIYGKSKLSGEEAVRDICPQHIILRTSWVFGRYGNNFVKTMLRLGQERDELSVVCDQEGCPTAAHHIAEAIIKVCQVLNKTENQDNLWGTYHFSGAPMTNWYAFAQVIFDVAVGYGLKSPDLNAIPTSDYPTPAKRPRYTVLDSSKIERKFCISSPDWHKALNLVVSTALNP